MSELNYGVDIAPLKNQFQFSSTAGDPRILERELQYHQQVLLPMKQQTMKLQKDQQEIRRSQQLIRGQNLAYETQKLALEASRNKFERENQDRARLPELKERVDNLLNSGSPEEIKDGMDIIARDNAGSGPIVTNYLDNINTILGKRQQEEKAKRDEERAKGAALANTYLGMGDIEKATGIYGSDGVIDDYEQASLDVATYNKEQAKMKVERERISKRGAAKDRKFKFILDQLKGIEFEEPKFKVPPKTKSRNGTSSEGEPILLPAELTQKSAMTVKSLARTLGIDTKGKSDNEILAAVEDTVTGYYTRDPEEGNNQFQGGGGTL